MYNVELLAIVEAFKSWRQYLEGCQYEVLLRTDYNNLHQFMNIKSLSFFQVRYAQKLFRYHFHIDYCQNKTNGAADALFRYPQRSQSKEKTFQAKNTRIIQCLQSSLSNAYVSSTFFAHVVSLKHIIICRTHILLDFCQSQELFCQKLAAKSTYQASIGGIRLRLVELQAENGQVQKIKAEKLDRNQKDSNEILHYQSLPYIPEIIKIELISRHYNDLLAEHLGIKKMQGLIARKYY